MDPRLCSNCRFIFKDPEHQKIRDTSRPRHQRHDYFASGVHHTSYQSLCDAIAAQCPICVTVLPICVPGEANPPPQTNPDEYTTYRIDYSCGDPSRTPKLLPKIWLHFYVGKGPGARSLYLVNLLPDHAGTVLAPTNLTELDHIGAWVKECVSSHMTCTIPTAGQFRYPTRLLQVNDVGNPQVQLVETATATMHGPYNVLSYRWGTSQPVTLLKGNIARFRNGIHLATLARTLVNAVETTRAMGVRYLWIDALCIIQDSAEDWASEARAMASVYGNAHCSLAASHNIDSNGGLSPLTPGNNQGQPISVRFPTTADWDVPFHDFQLVEHNFWNNRVEDAPLNTRGWVVQERTLAPRTIHFTFDQAMFECRQTRFSYTRTDLAMDISSSRRIILPISPSPSPSPTNPKPQSVPKSLTLPLAKYWATVVAYYTNRALSFPSDRPVAIAGIARALQTSLPPRTKTKYLAGLWSTALPRWLLWETANATYPEKYRAPSWSWLAVDGDIFWDSEVTTGVRYVKSEAHAKVERWRVVTSDGTAFGSVMAGVLEMRGVLLGVELRMRGGDFEGEIVGLKEEGWVGSGKGYGDGGGKGIREWIGEGEFSWAWDESVEVLAGRETKGRVFILLIMEVTPTKGSEDACLYGLIVERVDVKGRRDVYRRIGKVTVFGAPRVVVGKDQIHDGEKQTIRLL